ncbi:MAG: hypothetical protein ILP07_02190 [Treponema sp.]|nr:hypothetical protein [Treponema sp.]
MPAAAAGIAFAAEVSAGVRLTTDVFHVDHNDAADKNTISAFNITHENEFYHAPITFSVSGEKAGATLKLTTTKDAKDAFAGAWDIWFKPIDQVKFEVGVLKIAMNQEHIDWYRSASTIGDDGHGKGNFKLTLEPVEGFSFDAVLTTPGWNKAWLSKDNVPVYKVLDYAGRDGFYADPDNPTAAEKAAVKAAWDALTDEQKQTAIDAYVAAEDPSPAVGELGFMAKYSADFGAVSAMFKGAENFRKLTFGAGFSTSIDPISFFVNVLGFTDEKYDDFYTTTFDKLRVEAYAETTIDALSAKFWVPFEFKTNVADGTDSKDKIALGFLARLDYTVGDYTLFLQTGNDTDFIVDGDAFSLGIKPGVKFNVGECAIEAAVDVSVKKNFSFSVPVSFRVDF